MRMVTVEGKVVLVVIGDEKGENEKEGRQEKPNVLNEHHKEFSFFLTRLATFRPCLSLSPPSLRPVLIFFTFLAMSTMKEK